MDNFKGPEPVGCWESFIKGISSIWSTSDLLTGEETEERVRTVTRELGIYMVFLGILCWGKLLKVVSLLSGINLVAFDLVIKVIHPKYYKHLKKGAHQSHLGRQKMGWFLAD